MPFIRRVCGFIALTAAITPSLAFALGSTPVTVVNPTEIAKAQGIEKPFQATIQCVRTFGASCSGSTAVPSNQRLIIEYVSGSCEIDSRSQLIADVIVSTTSSGVSVSHYINVTDKRGVSRGGGVAFDANFGQQVRIYADTGVVFLTLFAAGLTTIPGIPDCTIALSGQAVSLP